MQDVSVIIPNFNGKKYLKGCLDSLRKQDYLYFEVILVDNGSEDGSVEWTKENYPSVKCRPAVGAATEPSQNQNMYCC